MTKKCGKCGQKKLLMQQNGTLPKPSPAYFVTMSTVACQGWPPYQYFGVLLSIRRSVDQVLASLN